MVTAPDWSLLITHHEDSAHTTAEQWITDDPSGHAWVTIDGAMLDLSVSNTAAVIRKDKLTPEWERASLAGGVGFFAEVARLSAWLGPVDEHERRRRLALCVGPEAYPVILATPKSKLLSARHIHEQISREWGAVEAPQAIGYLSAITAWAPPQIQDRLYRCAAAAACDPGTLPADRVRLCDLLHDWRKLNCSRTQVLHGCCLRVLADDLVEPAVQANAEDLLGHNVQI